MADQYLLGIDIGTGSTKGVLVRARDGEVLAQHAIEHSFSSPHPGWAEMDADKIWWGEFAQTSQELIRQAGVKPKDIKGVGVSGIGPCVLPIDADGKPLRAGILYGIDTRSTEEIEIYNREIGEERVFQLSACELSSSAEGTKVLWIARNEPEVYEKARWLLGSQAYVVYKLTGKASADVYSASAYAPLFDVEKRVWLDETIAGINPRQKLPPVYWTADVVGTVHAEAAAQCGLAEGIPVIAGTIDAAAEATSIGLLHPGEMMLMFGSSNSIILKADHFVRSRAFWGMNWLEQGAYSIVGGMSTAGSLTRWFSENLFKAQKPELNVYEEMAQMVVQTKPGANGLICLPYFEGERTPINDPNAKGMLFGLTLSHGQAEIYRAVLEWVGYGIRHNIEALKEEGAEAKRILAVGGGTRNLPWMQIVCDISGISMEIPTVQSGAAYGDAYMAGVGAGLFPAISGIRDWLKPGQVITPNASHKALYDEGYARYRQLYERTKDLM